ncbi:MAG: hypothetical protein P8O16_04740 [Algoriphagus sp.]|uniref:hypothetical protein n=1 Tax=Algoriphagus sp. TaxID=1872435 RepID=UPI002621F055|nr:hypothetical protein [Algoriphagus sp.]MDG1276565.1 hypothetical protein [Algoriphagus sp.]
MEKIRKNSYLLHDYDFRITSKIQKVLEEILPSPQHAERHVKNHSFKYFYVVDKILSTNLKFEKSPKASQPVCYNSLYDFTSKVKIEVKSGDFITFSKLILDVLQLGKIIKMTRPHDRDKKLCAEYQVVWKGLGNYRVYPFDYITNSSTQQKFITKLRKQGKSEFFIGSPAAIKMEEWMNLLDFSWVKTDSLKHKSKLYLEYYKSNKFQIKADTGRIYNSFTNLPRVIREKTRVQ